PGKKYSLENLKNERARLDAILKNHGYFSFSPDYLLFIADTSNLNHTVAFALTLKDSLPEKALKVYHIDQVNVNQNYTLNERRKINPLDTLMFHDIVFFGKSQRMAIRPKVLAQSIYLRPGELFSRQNHIITLSRLMSLGNYKLVQVNFAESQDTTLGLLDVNILMTPMRKRTFRAEIDLVSKSNNYTGPRMNVSLTNRNTFGGAELLKLNLAGSFEAQFSNKNLYSYSWNPQLELTFPRFLVPFNMKSGNSVFVPKTSIILSYNYQKRVQYFDMNTFRFSYGFKWKENIRKEHELNPIDISFTTVGNKSIAFNDTLEAHPFLKRSYEEQFIAGGSYIYTYSEQMLTGKKLQTYFQLSSELAGNAFSLVKRLEGKKPSPDNPNKIVGSIYSQYGKVSVDGRSYLNFKHSKIATRLFAGVAKPYGNSNIMPYTKQFFSGGPNSIRAFHINSVGPGTYFQQVDRRGFLQLGGEVKLEANAEYRFNIYSFFKGALFVDGGNVWLLKSNPSMTGSPFVLSNALNELAVGTGVGIRVDVSFFILRFDLAFPLRKPWLEGNKWVADQIDFRSPGWRHDNLVLNVAIGYPF
ncbi:MAG TPA: BamA/TamA family outer membrane protein, partial [Prolixibacteraceae bacterium]